MLVFTVAALLLVLGPAIAQLTIPSNVIFDPENPVCVVLNLDNYTRVLVREETSVKINCSYVRSTFITRNGITDLSRVTVRWLFAEQTDDLMSFMRPAGPLVLPADGRISIVGANNEILNNTGVRLPTLAVDGTTGEYTCQVCSDRGMSTEDCVNATVPIVGRRFPPDINEGDGTCSTVNFIVTTTTCRAGTNYCIPPEALQRNVDRIQLQCQHKPPPTPQTPTPQIGIWFLNGVQITSSDRGEILPATPAGVAITSPGQRLTITNLQIAPRGNYTCMLTNFAGSDVATTLITDCVPPVLRPGRRDDASTIQIGLSPHCLTTPQTTILCEVMSGSVPITYNWTRNGAPLAETSDRLMVTSVGRYVCNASNLYGSAAATTQVAVGPRISFMGGIAGRSDNGCGRLSTPSARRPDICVLIGETLEFMCVRADGGDPESSNPQITNPGSMVITGPVTNVQPTSDGMFRCSSNTTSCGTTSMIIDVQVFDPPVIDRNIALPTQPTIITGGAGRPDITTGSGSNVRLYCPSTGRPAATIAWQRRVGGNLVAVNPSFVSTTMVGGIPTALLTLNNVQAADFTEYVCTATNVVGNDTQSVTLVAAGSPPDIDEAPTPPGPPTTVDEDNIIRIGDGTCIPVGGNVRIDCNTITGSMPFTYEWRREGVLLANPNPPNSLVVTQAGSYMCTVRNSFGDDSATSQIQVTPPPVNFQITSSGPIDCSRLNPPPPDPINQCPRFTRVEFRCTVNVPGLQPQITFNGAPFTASFIDPFGTPNDGTYECTAQNTCGMSSQTHFVQAFQPAQVDINVPLPVPDTAGSIPGGAGRDPVNAPVGGNVTLFCPATGVSIPNTRWEINGMVVVSMPPRIVVSNRTINGVPFLILTISNISASDQITYTCVTMNADGEDRRTVVVQEPPRNEWCVETWSSCTPDCHRGTRNRTVVCKDNARRVLSDLSCAPPKPAQTDTCQTRGPCFLSPVWRHGVWSQCTAQCGTGSRTRPVECIIPRTGEVVDGGQCVHIVRPKSFQLCNTRNCCAADTYTLCRLVAGTPLCNMDIFRQVCCWTCGGT